MIAKPKEEKEFAFRQKVGVIALVLGILSIPAFNLVSGQNFFAKITSPLQLDILLMYFFLFASFIHKFAMIFNSGQKITGPLSVIVWVAMIFSISFSPHTDSGSTPQALEILLSMVIFYGWFFVDLYDSVERM